MPILFKERKGEKVKPAMAPDNLRLEMSDNSIKNSFVDPPPGFVTKKQCARHLGKHPNTIDRMRQRRMIPYYRIGGSIMFKLPEVEAALARFRVKEVSL
jgi:hypothetical protein